METSNYTAPPGRYSDRHDNAGGYTHPHKGFLGPLLHAAIEGREGGRELRLGVSIWGFFITARAIIWLFYHATYVGCLEMQNYILIHLCISVNRVALKEILRPRIAKSELRSQGIGPP
jgi:hypothetical protein